MTEGAELRPPLPAGLILAGGRSTRMGRPKAGLQWGGETLLARQHRVLGGVGISRILLSVGHPEDPHAPLHGKLPEVPPGLEVVPDGRIGAGPLAGIAAALERVEADPACPGILVLAVDMPRVTPELLQLLLRAASPGRGGAGVGAAYRVQGRLEPLAAYYPRRAGPRARALLELAGAGSASPSALLEEMVAEGTIEELEPPPGMEQALASWNRPGDLEPPPPPEE